VGKEEDNPEGETVSWGGGDQQQIWIMMMYLGLRLFA